MARATALDTNAIAPGRLVVSAVVGITLATGGFVIGIGAAGLADLRAAGRAVRAGVGGVVRIEPLGAHLIAHAAAAAGRDRQREDASQGPARPLFRTENLLHAGRIVHLVCHKVDGLG